MQTNETNIEFDYSDSAKQAFSRIRAQASTILDECSSLSPSAYVRFSIGSCRFRCVAQEPWGSRRTYRYEMLVGASWKKTTQQGVRRFFRED